MKKLNIVLGFLIIITALFCSSLFSYAETDDKAELNASEVIEENSIGPDPLKAPKDFNNGPEIQLDWDIRLTANVLRGFIVKTSQKTGKLNVRTLDPSIVEAKVIDANDERGYYCEIIGKRAGKTTLILEDSGTVLEKEVNVSGPDVNNIILNWDINLEQFNRVGFIVETNYRTGKLNLRTLDPSIVEAKVIDANDERGYYCEIIGKRAGKTTLILEDSGTVLEKEVNVSGPELRLDWDIRLTANVLRGFIVKTSQKTGKLNVRTLDTSIAEAKVIDANDERGYYCEIIGKRAGKTTLILEDSGTVLEKEVNVSGPELRLDWDIRLTANVLRGFIVKTSQKTGKLNVRTLDTSIAEAKVIDANDERGYYCEIIGKRAGKTTLILEDSGTVLEKEVNVSGPELRLDWDIRLTANVLRGFIVKTSQKTGKLNVRTLDPSIVEAKVIDANDERGYYCEIIGKRAGKTTLILEDSGTVLEKEVNVSGPDVNNIILNWDINLEQFNRVGFIVETNYRTGKLNLRTLDPSIAEAKVIDANDERGYYCEIIGKRAGKTTLILEDSGTVLEKEVNVKATILLNKNLENYLNALEGWYGYSEASDNYKEIIDVYNEHSPLALGYKVKYTDEWCDTYISAAAIKAGIVSLIGTECGCERHIDIFKAKGIWIEDGRITPQVGDIIVYNWDAFGQPNDGFSDHIGVVKSVQNGYIMVIEGNINERVGYRKIPVGWGYIRGYARPDYDFNGTSTYPTAAGSESLYTLDQFRPMGVIKWKGYTYKYYSELVLPGTGLNIPGRHVDGGFVRDIDGYIVVANSQLDKGTIVPTPFGADGKVYDRTTTTADVIDIYIH